MTSSTPSTLSAPAGTRSDGPTSTGSDSPVTTDRSSSSGRCGSVRRWRHAPPRTTSTSPTATWSLATCRVVPSSLTITTSSGTILNKAQPGAGTSHRIGLQRLTDREQERERSRYRDLAEGDRTDHGDRQGADAEPSTTLEDPAHRIGTNVVVPATAAANAARSPTSNPMRPTRNDAPNRSPAPSEAHPSTVQNDGGDVTGSAGEPQHAPLIVNRPGSARGPTGFHRGEHGYASASAVPSGNCPVKDPGPATAGRSSCPTTSRGSRPSIAVTSIAACTRTCGSAHGWLRMCARRDGATPSRSRRRVAQQWQRRGRDAAQFGPTRPWSSSGLVFASGRRCKRESAQVRQGVRSFGSLRRYSQPFGLRDDEPTATQTGQMVRHVRSCQTQVVRRSDGYAGPSSNATRISAPGVIRQRCSCSPTQTGRPTQVAMEPNGLCLPTEERSGAHLRRHEV